MILIYLFWLLEDLTGAHYSPINYVGTGSLYAFEQIEAYLQGTYRNAFTLFLFLLYLRSKLAAKLCFTALRDADYSL